MTSLLDNEPISNEKARLAFDFMEKFYLSDTKGELIQKVTAILLEYFKDPPSRFQPSAEKILFSDLICQSCQKNIDIECVCDCHKPLPPPKDAVEEAIEKILVKIPFGWSVTEKELRDLVRLAREATPPPSRDSK